MARSTKSAVAEAPVNFMAAVKAVAVPATTAKAKSKHPTVALPEVLAKNLVAGLAAKKAKAQAEADITENFAPVIAHVRGIQDEDALRGSFNGSYTVEGGTAAGLFVSADSWSVPQDDAVVAELKVLGAAEIIRERYEIKVRDEVMLNKALQAELMAKIGDAFSKFFEAERKLETVPGLNESIYRIAGGDKVRMAKIRELVKQRSPYIK